VLSARPRERDVRGSGREEENVFRVCRKKLKKRGVDRGEADLGWDEKGRNRKDGVKLGLALTTSAR